MRGLIIAMIIFLGFNLSAQDTIRMMQYNLLMYGNNFGGCNSSNNNVNDKNGYLKTIVDYVQPDIVFVNELFEDENYHDLILNNVFNTSGNAWSRADILNLGNSFIVNQVFYKNQVFELANYVAVQTNVRDIDLFRFNILPTTETGLGEPVELNCAVGHLKAGSDDGDKQERAFETNKLMNYLNNSGLDGNFTFSGDFNLYSGSEQALQNLLNYANPNLRFFDPINQVGNWNNNEFYAAIHTQSTHEYGDCFSGGGMDDRFDFFLVSEEILSGNQKIKYLDNSYHAVGQDGEHFNNSLTSPPTNTSVPGNVLQALYNMSDHLPVVIDIVVDPNLSVTDLDSSPFNFTFNNPADDQLSILISGKVTAQYSIDLLNAFGIIMAHTITSETEFKLDISNLPQGIYFLRMIQNQHQVVTRKLIIR